MTRNKHNSTRNRFSKHTRNSKLQTSKRKITHRVTHKHKTICKLAAPNKMIRTITRKQVREQETRATRKQVQTLARRTRLRSHKMRGALLEQAREPTKTPRARSTTPQAARKTPRAPTKARSSKATTQPQHLKANLRHKHRHKAALKAKPSSTNRALQQV